MASFLNSIGYNGWILPALLAIPLVGALAILLLPARQSGYGGGVETPAARTVAPWVFLLEFVVSLGLWWSFNPADTGWQASIDAPWIPTWGVRFTLGVDGIALMLVLTTGMLGVFLARDLFLFYVMWDVMLVPMYFIIGIWGGERRIYASIKFFIYTMVGSLLMLVAIVYVGLVTRDARTGALNFNYDHVLLTLHVSHTSALWLFGAF